MNPHVLVARRKSQRVGSVVELVGNTPLVRIQRITSHLPASVEVYAKLEHFNPGGSVKDRAARQMMLDALGDGRLTPEKTLIDSTSGNTGVAYSILGAALGQEIALVMPSNVSQARKDLAEAFGTRVIFSDPLESSDGAIRQAKKLVEEDAASGQPRYFYPDQYANASNPGAHEATTAQEIWAATQGRVTHFVAGMGTSGTVMGTGRGLKAKSPSVQIVGVEPDDSFHGLEGLKHMPSSIVPPIYHEQELDRLIRINTDAGWDMTERLAREEGILGGYSCGAAMAAALQVAEGLERGVIVAIFPDHADRYAR